MTNLVKTINGRQVNITADQLAMLEMLNETVGGGFATVHGYRPKSGYEVSPVVNINFVSRFSYLKHQNKILDNAQDIEFADINWDKSPKLKKLDAAQRKALFATAHGEVLTSLTKTRDGIRTDAHRQAHDKFYIQSVPGVKVHLQTHKVDGKTRLVTVGGIPVVERIMLHILEVGRKEVQKGVSKPGPNSQAKTLVKRQIENKAKEGLPKFKTLTLGDDNYDSVKIGGEEISPDMSGHLALVQS